MYATKIPWRTWLKLLTIPAVTTVMFLLFFFGPRGNAVLSSADGSADTNFITATNPFSILNRFATSPTIIIYDVDAVLLFDVSNSTEFETVCYGCWEVADGQGYDYTKWPVGEGYPGGVRHPLTYPTQLCTGYAPEDMYHTYNGREYVVIEAEHYYNNWPVFDPNYQVNKTSYWGLQRNGQGSSTFNDDPGRCSDVNEAKAGCGGYMQHNPFYTDSPAQVYDSSELAWAPQLTYRFQVPVSGAYRLWLRAQGGTSDEWSAGLDARTIHWGLNGAYRKTITDSFEYGGNAEGARYDAWRWQRVDEFSLSAGQTYNLNIWAGGTGFCLDKVVITNEFNDDVADDILRNDGTTEERKGPSATAGRSGFACWQCYPYYGLPASPECQATWDASSQWPSMHHAIFDDKQPLRAFKEAGKLFVGQADLQHHQIGVVSFATTATVRSELECLVRLDGACTSKESILETIETLLGGGGTNMGDGMRLGLEVLGSGAGHFGRSDVKKVLILATDGVPDQFPNACQGIPDLWPGDDIAYDCVIYYAQQAAANSAAIYTVGLGERVDEELLSKVANITGGHYYPAPVKEDLDAVLDQIAQDLFYEYIWYSYLPTLSRGRE